MTTINLNTSINTLVSDSTSIDTALQNLINFVPDSSQFSFTSPYIKETAALNSSTWEMIVQSSQTATVNSTSVLDYMVLKGTNSGASFPSGTVTEIDIYSQIPTSVTVSNLASLGSYATANLATKLNISSTSYVMTVGGTTVTMTGTSLPTSGVAVNSLMTSSSSTVSLALTGLTISDGAGDTLTLSSTAGTLTLGSGAGDHYAFNMTFDGATSPLTLSASQFQNFFADGLSKSMFSESITGMTIVDTTTSATLGTLTGMSSLTLGTLLSRATNGGIGNVVSIFGSTDLLNMASANVGVSANLSDFNGTSSSSANVGNVIGSSFSDIIVGGFSNEVINGGMGDDTLIGQQDGSIYLQDKQLWKVSNSSSGEHGFYSDNGNTVLVNNGTSQLTYFVSTLNSVNGTAFSPTVSATLGASATAIGSSGTDELLAYNYTNNTLSVVSVNQTGSAVSVRSDNQDSFYVTSDGKYAAYLSGSGTANLGLYLRDLTKTTATLLASNALQYSSVYVDDSGSKPKVYYTSLINGTQALTYFDLADTGTLTAHTLLLGGAAETTSTQFEFSDNGRYVAYIDWSNWNSTNTASVNVVDLQASSVLLHYSDISITDQNTTLGRISNDGSEILVKESVMNNGTYMGATGILYTLDSSTTTASAALTVFENENVVMSKDGSYVLFDVSDVAGNENVYLYNVASNTSTLLSVGSNGQPLNSVSDFAISADGSSVLLFSQVGATNSEDALLLNISTGLNSTQVGASVTDVLIGGFGADTLVGANGHDVYAYNTIAEGGDTILNFNAATDTVMLYGGAANWGIANGATPTIATAVLNGATSAYLYTQGSSLYYVSAADASANLAGTMLLTTSGVTLTTGNVVVGAAAYTGTGATVDFSGQTNVGVLSSSAAASSARIFTGSAQNLTSNATVIGSTGNDTLILSDATGDLSSLTLSSVEVLSLSNTGSLTDFTLSQGNVSSLKTIVGTTASTDVLMFSSTSTNLAATSLALTSVEALMFDNPGDGGTLVLSQAQASAVQSIVGGNANDTLLLSGGTANLTADTLVGIAVVGGATAGTTFTMGTAQLNAINAVLGTSGTDVLNVTGSSVNLSALTLSSIEKIAISSSAATNTLILSGTDFSNGVSIVGTTGRDILISSIDTANLATFGATLSGIDVLMTDGAASAKLVLNQAEITSLAGGTIVGGTGHDALVAASGGTGLNLTGVTLTGMEALNASSSTTNAMTFTLGAAQLASGLTNINGGTLNDTLVVASPSANMAGITLSSIEYLAISSTAALNTLTLGQGAMASGISILGATGKDMLVASGDTLNLATANAALSSIEILKTDGAATAKLVLNQAELSSLGVGTILGGAGTDVLALSSASTLTSDNSFSLASATLSGIDVISVSTANLSDSTLSLGTSQLASGVSVIKGESGYNDTLVVTNGTSVDLSGITLSSIDVLSLTSATQVTLSQSKDLSSLGAIIGNASTDTLLFVGGSADLSNVELSSVEVFKAGGTSALNLTISASALSGNSVIGSTGADSLTVNASSSANLSLTNVTMSGVESLTLNASAATATLSASQFNGLSAVAAGGSDTLIISGAGTTANLGAITGGFSAVYGGSGSSLIIGSPTALTGATVGGVSETLLVNSASIDLSGVTLSGVSVLKAGTASATTFTLSSSDTASSIVGTSLTDAIVLASTSLDLSAETISGVEVFNASSAGQTLTLNANALSGSSRVNGISDLVLTGSSSANLANITLSGVSTVDLTGETGGVALNTASASLIQAGTNQTFIYSQTNGAAAYGNTIVGFQGGSGHDTILLSGLWGIPKTGVYTTAPTATTSAYLLLNHSGTDTLVDYVDANGTTALLATVVGASLDASDVLIQTNVASGVLNNMTVGLTSATQVGLGTGALTNVMFDVVQGKIGTAADTITISSAVSGTNVLSSGASVLGSSGADTLIFNDASVNLSGMTLSSIEVLRDSAAGAVLTLAQSDLSGGLTAVQGTSGTNTLVAAGGSLDLNAVTLSNIQVLKTNGSNTVLSLSTANLAGLTSISAGGTTDALVVTGAVVDLSAKTLSGIESLTLNTNTGVSLTLTAAEAAAFSQIQGGSGADSLTVAGTGALSVNLTNTVVSGIETLKAGTAATSVTYALDMADLSAGGSVVGTAGTDTLIINGVLNDLTTVTLSSIEAIKLAPSAPTASLTTLNLTEELALKSFIGQSSQSDTLVFSGNTVNLSGATLSSVEVLKMANSASISTLTLVQADLGSANAIIGNGTDVLVAAGATMNLANATLTGITTLQAGVSASAFTVSATDLNSGVGSLKTIIGSTGSDTLALSGPVDLSSITLSSIDVLAFDAGGTAVLSQADLMSGGKMTGTALLLAGANSLDLSGTTLSGAFSLQAMVPGSTFTLSAGNLGALSSVTGTSAADMLLVSGSSANLSTATLSSIDIIGLTGTTGNQLTVSQSALMTGGTLLGSTGTDTLVVTGSSVDLGSTTLSSFEIIKAGATNGMTIGLNQSDLGGNTTVVGSTGVDWLVSDGATLDLSGATLSSVEVLKAGSRAATTFVINQGDIGANGSTIIGTAGKDTLAVTGGTLNLASSTLSGIEVVKAGSAASTTFTLNTAELNGTGLSLLGARGTDTLVLSGTNFDLSSDKLSSIEVVKGGGASLALTVSGENLSSVSSIVGTAGTDTLVVSTAGASLANTAVSGVEVIKFTPGSSNLILTQAALVSGGSLIGVGGNDQLIVTGSSIDLSNSTVTGFTVLQDGSSSANVTMKLSSSAVLNSVIGGNATDTLLLTGGAINLTGKTISGVEVLSLGGTGSTATLSTAQLTGGSAVSTLLGSTGVDVVTLNSNLIDLTNVSLSGIDVVKEGLIGNSTIVVNQTGLASSFVGNSGADTLIATGASVNLSSVVLSSIEKINSNASTLVLSQSDLTSVTAVMGSGGTLVASGGSLNATSLGYSLSGFQVLQAGGATAFTLTQDQVPAFSSINGSTGVDSLVLNSTSINLTGVALSGIEVIKAGTTAATSFVLGTSDLANASTVIGTTGADTLQLSGSNLNLASVTLSGVEVTKLNATGGAVTLSQSAVVSGGSLYGSTASDYIIASGSSLDLSGLNVLSGVEALLANSGGTTFTLTSAQLAGVGTIAGSAGVDALVVNGGTANLTGLNLTSLDVVKVNNATGAQILVNSSDFDTGKTLIGTTGADTLQLASGNYYLGNSVLSGIEVVSANNGMYLSVNSATLGSVKSLIGSTATDIIMSNGNLDLSGLAVMSGIDIIGTSATLGSTITVNGPLLTGSTQIWGGAGTDTLVMNGTSANLGSVSLSSIEVLKAGSAGETFSVSQSAVSSLTGIIGSTGSDTIVASGTSLNLSAITLSSIEVIKAGTTASTTFQLSGSDLTSGGQIIGTAGTADLISISGGNFNLSSTTLSGIENLQMLSSGTVTIGQTAIAGGLKSLTGSGGLDTLVLTGTSANLSSVTLNGFDVIRAGATAATSITVNQADLSGGVQTIMGTTGIDTLVSTGAIDLTGISLAGVEIVTTTSNAGVALTGSAGNETLIGGTGNDTLNGGNGTDLLIGGGGKDIFELNNGYGFNATLSGGAGGTADLIDFSLGTAVRSGSGNSNFSLTLNNSSVTVLNQFSGTTAGLGALSTVLINGGTYALQAGYTATTGNNILVGTTGADTLTVAGAGSDVLYGGGGNDLFQVTSSSFTNVTIVQTNSTGSLLDMGNIPTSLTAAENDGMNLILSFGSGKTITVANEFADIANPGVQYYADQYQTYGLVVTTGSTAVNSVDYNLYTGSTGNNLIVGDDNQTNLIDASASTGSNLLFGGLGTDVLIAGDFGSSNYLSGGAGANTLIGGAGTNIFSTANEDGSTTDTLFGGSGDNTYLLSGLGTATIDASSGKGTYVLADTLGTVTLNNSTYGDGSVISIDNQASTDMNAFVRSGSDLTIGFTNGGSLTLTGEYNGTNGVDTVAGHGWTATLVNTGTDLLADQHTATANLIMVGNDAAAQTLYGGSGADVMVGNHAGDLLYGGQGSDHLTAWSAATVFYYEDASEGGDTISGFSSGRDTIEVYASSTSFGNLATGTLTSANFTTVSTASNGISGTHVAEFVYNTTNNTLFFYAANSGTGTAIATFNNSDAVSASDILVVNNKLV